ncbi:LOW QUALITY PROTEIN: hypothetical protein Q4I31_001959, partial [Leishmania lindenbergi]
MAERPRSAPRCPVPFLGPLPALSFLVHVCRACTRARCRSAVPSWKRRASPLPLCRRRMRKGGEQCGVSCGLGECSDALLALRHHHCLPVLLHCCCCHVGGHLPCVSSSHRALFLLPSSRKRNMRNTHTHTHPQPFTLVLRTNTLNRLLTSLSFSPTMREAICIHIGQAGCQVGN